MALPGPFLAGQRLTAGQLNDATQKTIKSVAVGVAGGIGTTSGTTELDIPQLAIGPVDLVAGGLYEWAIRMTVQLNGSAAQGYNINIRRDTPVTGTVVATWVIYNQAATTGSLIVGWADMISTVDETVNFYTSVVRTSGTNTLTVFGQLSGTNRSGIKLTRTGYSSEHEVVT